MEPESTPTNHGSIGCGYDWLLEEVEHITARRVNSLSPLTCSNEEQGIGITVEEFKRGVETESYQDM